MTDERKIELNETTPTILQVITGKVKEVTALVKAISVLILALGTLWVIVQSRSSEKPPQYPDLAGCFDARWDPPQQALTLSQWEKDEFIFKVRNACGRKLDIHVEFKSLDPSIRINLPVDCNRPDENPDDCWPAKFLDPKEEEEEWALTPPRLYSLKNPDGDAARVQLKWMIYEGSQKKIAADTAVISLLNDPPSSSEVALNQNQTPLINPYSTGGLPVILRTTQ